jgi:hypothetical protein
VTHYIHRLTDKYNGLIFLPLPFLAASLPRVPPK